MSASDSAVLDWHDGQPHSRRFGDVYFSRSGGLEEARHVFLQGNDLPARWVALKPGEGFAVGEIGFGTGLNFLCAWQAFVRHAPATAQLHYVSCELEPLSAAELARALALWPELADPARALLDQYRRPAPGWHRFVFPGHRVHLTLLVGDARACLPRLSARIDAWFFDGFSPARNPELWEPGLFRAAAACSATGATLATYSVAGSVRRAADAAGFALAKTPGFGSKREMLRGRLRDEACPRAAVPAPAASAMRAGCAAPPRSATVIGGGLAGCAAAFSLARRGLRVRLLERHAGIAAEASGNAQGVLYARLGAGGSPLHAFVLAGYQYSLRLLRALLPCDGRQWSDSPVLQLAMDAAEARRQAAVAGLGLPAELVRAVDAQTAGDIAGFAVERGGLMFEGGGWVHPPALCAALSAAAGIELLTAREALALRQAGAGIEIDAAGDRLVEEGVVVLALAGGALQFPASAHLPLRLNRGQVTLLPATASSARLRAVVCADRYVAPARAGLHTAGASFAREALTDARAEDDAENLAMLAQLSPALHAELAAGLDGAATGHSGATSHGCATGHSGIDAHGSASPSRPGLVGRAGLRCVSPDYVPLVGALADAQGQLLPSVLASLAHGSRGLISAPLAGEVLAACVTGEPAPLPVDLMAALAPLRFGAQATRSA